jgi:hypothetical protein
MCFKGSESDAASVAGIMLIRVFPPYLNSDICLVYVGNVFVLFILTSFCLNNCNRLKGVTRETEEAMLALNSRDCFATLNYLNAVNAVNVL